jgi:hypothetical protein
MKKGHYGDYTGNARHSRKQEMIHDREMIYDAKTQIHNEDKKYKESGSDSDKRDMIHERELIHDTKTQLHHADQDYKNDSPLNYKAGDIHSGSTGAYDAENNEFSAEISRIEGIGKVNEAFGEAAGSVITALGEKNSDGGGETPNQNLGMGENNQANYFSNTPSAPGMNPDTYVNEVQRPEVPNELYTFKGKGSDAGGGNQGTYTNKMAWENMDEETQNTKFGGNFGNFEAAALPFQDANPDMVNKALKTPKGFIRDDKTSSYWNNTNSITKGLFPAGGKGKP